MTQTSRSPALHDPAQVASAMRLLAEATDRRAFFTTLQEAMSRLLPETRVDILANEPHNGDYVLLSSGGEANALLPPGRRTAAGFAEWLGAQGYAAVSTLPLAGAGRHLGWLLLARRSTPFEPDTIAMAGQFAAMIALRLLYDQNRDDLADRDTYSALLEQRLREAEAIRQRAMLAAGAAHDIGNLFASVLGYIELLDQSAPATIQPDLRAIRRAAGDGQQLIRRLLALNTSRATMSHIPITLMPTVIRDAIKLTQPFWDTRANITVRTTLSPVPPVRGNAVELREVLINLIMNALSAMPNGGVLTMRSFVGGEHVFVAVTDTGEGIAVEHHGAIFQPFVSTRADGSGLGLSVSRTIVESYGGTLTVESALGEGATFTLALPAVRSLDTLHETQPHINHTCAAL
jgi:signal transduction histidine kinase